MSFSRLSLWIPTLLYTHPVLSTLGSVEADRTCWRAAHRRLLAKEMESYTVHEKSLSLSCPSAWGGFEFAFLKAITIAKSFWPWICLNFCIHKSNLEDTLPTFMVSSHSITFHAVLLQSLLSSLPGSCYLFGDIVPVSGFGGSAVSEEVAEHESQTPHRMILCASAFSHLLAARGRIAK